MVAVRPVAIWLFCLTFTASTVSAQTTPRAAVVTLDDLASSRGLDREAARILTPTQMTVLYGDELDAWIEKRREPEPEPEVLAKFAPATQTIAKGVESFFYMSPERALPAIEPVIDLAWHHPAVLAFRPDLADQIWQAGIILVRAYAETEGAEAAQLHAERLLTLLPSRETDPKIVPPDTREVLEAARARLAAGGATVRLSAPDPQRCVLYLNGARAEPQRAYVVDPAGSYFAHADCSEPVTPPIWRVDVRRDHGAEVLVAPIEPQHHRPDNGDRQRIEWYLRATSALADADVTVGVMTFRSDADNEHSVVLVRYDRSTQAMTWSDDEYSDSIRRGMPRIFPEYAKVFDDADPSAQTDSARPPPRTNWFVVSAVGMGAAAGGVGTYLVFAAGRQSRLLDCAVNNPSPPRDADCSGVADDTYFENFAEESRKVGTARTGGIVLISVGALAAGYGIYRLIRGPRTRHAGSAWIVNPSGLEVRW